MAKSMVRKKVMGKERRSKKERFVKSGTYAFFKPRQLPLSPQNSGYALFTERRQWVFLGVGFATPAESLIPSV
jgi:hypothetical protein